MPGTKPCSVRGFLQGEVQYTVSVDLGGCDRHFSICIACVRSILQSLSAHHSDLQAGAGPPQFSKIKAGRLETCGCVLSHSISTPHTLNEQLAGWCARWFVRARHVRASCSVLLLRSAGCADAAVDCQRPCGCKRCLGLICVTVHTGRPAAHLLYAGACMSTGHRKIHQVPCVTFDCSPLNLQRRTVRLTPCKVVTARPSKGPELAAYGQFGDVTPACMYGHAPGNISVPIRVQAVAGPNAAFNSPSN
jgi:hypothetical protein